MGRRKSRLADISQLKVDVTAPVEDRVAALVDFTRGDPYHFRVGEVEVEVAFAGEASVEEILAHHLDVFGDIAPARAGKAGSPASVA